MPGKNFLDYNSRISSCRGILGTVVHNIIICIEGSCENLACTEQQIPLLISLYSNISIRTHQRNRARVMVVCKFTIMSFSNNQVTQLLCTFPKHFHALKCIMAPLQPKCCHQTKHTQWGLCTCCCHRPKYYLTH